MLEIPTFRHPQASRAFALVRGELRASEIDLQAAQPCPIAERDPRSYGLQLIRPSRNDGPRQQLMLEWGYSADKTAPSEAHTGHVYLSIHEGSDSVAVLCRCGSDICNGEWRLELSRPQSRLSQMLELVGPLMAVGEATARIHMRRLIATFRQLSEDPRP